MKTIHDYAGWAGRLPSDEPAKECPPKLSSGGLGSDGAHRAQFRPALSPQVAAEELIRRHVAMQHIIAANCSPSRHEAMLRAKILGEAERLRVNVISFILATMIAASIAALMMLIP